MNLKNKYVNLRSEFLIPYRKYAFTNEKLHFCYFHSERVSFTSDVQSAPLRSNRNLVRHITQTATIHIEYLRSQPEYRQITHSKRIFQNLTEITRLLYERCIKRLPKLWSDFEVTSACLSAECFRQCLLTVDSLYKRKFDAFLKGVGKISNVLYF